MKLILKRLTKTNRPLEDKRQQPHFANYNLLKHRSCVPRLDQCLGRATTGVVTGSPALVYRSACYSEELAVLCSGGVWGADNRPQVPVPLFDKRLKDTAAICVVACGAVIRRRGTAHRSEVVIIHGTTVGR